MAGDGNGAPTGNGGALSSGGTRTPTEEMYGDLQRAYKRFNADLFQDTLPECLITLRARGRTNGYFSEGRFQHVDGRRTAEIALNPERFFTRTIEACLSTLVHEMVHLWQKLHGNAPRRPYHNKEFSEKMEEVGLITSNTGEPGGRRVGQQMTHYIQPGGRFLLLTRDLLDDGFRARWADRFRTYSDTGEWRGWQEPVAAAVVEPSPGASLAIAVALEPQAAAVVEQAAPAEPLGLDPATVTPPEVVSIAQVASAAASDPAALPRPSVPMVQLAPDDYQHGAHQRSLRSKTKWVCPSCGDAAWGKPSLALKCINCDAPLRIAAGLTEAEPVIDSMGTASNGEGTDAAAPAGKPNGSVMSPATVQGDAE